jgi:hypothetical protein
MPLLRNRYELASAVCFIGALVVSLALSTVLALPLFVAGVALSLRARGRARQP